MNGRRIRCLALSLLAYVAGAVCTATAGEARVEEERLVSISRSGSPRELAVSIERHLSSAPMSELDRLASLPDTTLALAAAWERVCRTMPAAKQDEAATPDGKAIARFLRLVEGSIRSPVPTAWVATVKSAKGYSQRDISFSRPQIGEQAPFGRGLLRAVGDRWIVKKDIHLIKLPATAGSGPTDEAAVEISGETAYVALYGWPPVPYKLFAIEQGSNKVIWSNDVWAAGGLRGYSGLGCHVVTMGSAQGTLAIFGFSERCVYMEVFDEKTGANRWRFSTAYFNAISPKGTRGRP